MPSSDPAFSFLVRAEDPRERLDVFLVSRLSAEGYAFSRSAIKRWILEGNVRVDGNVAQAAQALRLGAEILASPSPPPPSAAAPDPSVRFGVLYEDDHLLVVDKPAGLVVHPAKGHWEGTLVNGLLARGTFHGQPPRDLRDPAALLRPGIVHRLDRDTSGVLVVAKTDHAREDLKAQFAVHAIERAYQAIVVGQAQAGTIASLYGRHPVHRLKFSSLVNEGKRAVTHVETIESLAGGLATLVRCRLETGRTHQIRVHLWEQGHTPILGDQVYGRKPAEPIVRAIAHQLGRQALHASLLAIRHPVTGVDLRFEAPPPGDFMRALEDLRALPAPNRP